MRVRAINSLTGVLVVATLQLIGSSPAMASTPLCFGHPATIVGTDGDDTLTGQGGVSDVIVGLGGNDHVSGGDFYGDDEIPGDAPDFLCGGRGDDVVHGSPGDDHLNGGGGNDRVKGWNGDDVE